MIYDKTPIKDAENLTQDRYVPCCMTPLYDAIGITIQKLKKASQKYPAKSILLAGGVSANQELRTQLKKSFSKTHQVFFPDPKLSTDNGAMVASAAYYSIQSGESASDPYDLDISPRSIIH